VKNYVYVDATKSSKVREGELFLGCRMVFARQIISGEIPGCSVAEL